MKSMRQMRVRKDNLELIHSSLVHFLGEVVTDLSRHEDLIIFQTYRGAVGTVEENVSGNYDVKIDEEIVYEIEKDLFDVIEYDTKTNLISFYKHICTIDPNSLKFKSKTFLEIIRISVENIIMDMDMCVDDGSVTVGPFQVYCKNDTKIVIGLN